MDRSGLQTNVLIRSQPTIKGKRGMWCKLLGTGSGSRRTSSRSANRRRVIEASISSLRQVEDGLIDSTFIDDPAVIVPPSFR